MVPAGACWDNFTSIALLQVELGLVLASQFLWKPPNYNGSSDDIVLPSVLQKVWAGMMMTTLQSSVG